MNSIDAALLAAHAAGDGQAMMRLYALAAETAQTPDAAAFFLTHAYVFALETGHADAQRLHQQLVNAGREHPASPPRAPLR
ncbi:MAG: hypothetical protein WA782_11520 [Sulfitobacter sp.]